MSVTVTPTSFGRLQVTTTRKELLVTEVFDALRQSDVDGVWCAFFDSREEGEDCDHRSILLERVTDVDECPACRKILDHDRVLAWEQGYADAREEWRTKHALS